MLKILYLAEGPIDFFYLKQKLYNQYASTNITWIADQQGFQFLEKNAHDIVVVGSGWEGLEKKVQEFVAKRKLTTKVYAEEKITPEKQTRGNGKPERNDATYEKVVINKAKHEVKQTFGSEMSFFEQLFEQSTTVMLVVDPKDCIVLLANEAAHRFFGYHPKSMLGMEYGKLCPTMVGKTKTLPAKKGIADYLMADGSSLQLGFSANMMHMENRELVAFSINDIAPEPENKSVLQETLEELKVRNYELDNFVYKVSHDIRAPLCSIQGLANLIQMSNPSGDVQAYAEMILGRILKLDRFATDVLSYSKNLNLPVSSSPIDFRSIVNQVLAELNYDPETHPVVVNVKINGVEYAGDSFRVKEIFKNLVANALQFYQRHAESKSLEIAINVDTEKATIVFEDTGIGIPVEVLPNIFSMFFRGNENSPGSGIGLYIVAQTLEKLKGSIEVWSVVNQGTTFTIQIPQIK